MRLSVIIVGLALVMSALAEASAQPDQFDSETACKAAYNSGVFAPYAPSFLSNHREPGPGEEIRELEADACVLMDVVGPQDKWVIQQKGTKFIFKNRVPVARYDCGNKVSAVAYLVAEVVMVPILKAEAIVIPPLDAFEWRRYTPPSAPAPVESTPVIEKKRNWKKVVGFVAVGIAAAVGINSKWGNPPSATGKTEGPGRPPG